MVVGMPIIENPTGVSLDGWVCMGVGMPMVYNSH